MILRCSTGMPLDKEAASRFIKAGIANQPSKPSDSSTFYSAEATVNDPLAGPGPHSRLSSLARISTPKEEDGSSGLASSSSSSSSDGEADLQVYTSMVAPASSQAQKVQASPKEGPTPEITSQGVVSQADSDKKKRKQEKKRKRLLGTDVETAGFRKTLLDPLQGMCTSHVSDKVTLPTFIAGYDREGGAAGQPKKAKTQTGGNQDGSSRASSVSNLQSDSTAASGKDAGEHKKKKRKRKQQALH